MTYHYGKYWAEIQPVRSQDCAIRYWQYKIYESLSNKFLFDGYDGDFESARITAEGHIDLLMSSAEREAA